MGTLPWRLSARLYGTVKVSARERGINGRCNLLVDKMNSCMELWILYEEQRLAGSAGKNWQAKGRPRSRKFELNIFKGFRRSDIAGTKAPTKSGKIYQEAAFQAHGIR